jgi:tetratricopeptide (TPR) repeat protein
MALHFYVTAIKHRSFGFADMRADRAVEEIRGYKNIAPKYGFPIDSIMLAAIKKYPGRCEPYRVLGEFYSDTRDVYGKDWGIPVDSQTRLSTYYCTIAMTKGCADWKTYSILGFNALMDSNSAKGIEYLSISASLEDAPLVTFSLAYAYLFQNKNDSTIKYARRAMNNFPKDNLRANSARLVAEACKRRKNYAMAWAYCDSAVQMDSSDMENRAGVLDLYLSMNNYEKALPHALAIFNAAPESPANLNVISSLYAKYTMQDSLPGLFQALLKTQKSDQALGNVYFHKAVYYLQKKNETECRKAIIAARGYFEKNKLKNKQVIDMLDQKLKELR